MLLGIDIAESTGAAWGGETDGFPRSSAVWQLPEGPANFNRALGALRMTVAATIRQNEIKIVCIEDWMVVMDRWHSKAALVKLIALGAVAREAAISLGCQVFTPPPATWRKFFIGTGALDREEAKAAAVQINRRFNWPFHNVDVAEANGIWAWGMANNYPRWRMEVRRRTA